MMVNLPVLIPATVPIAGLPRLFLHDAIPGYISERNTLCLPLTMGPQAVDTGIHKDDTHGMARYFLDRRDFFVHEDPEFQFHGGPEDYLESVRPAWIQEAISEVEEAIRSYENQPAGRSALVQRRVLRPLLQGWGDVRSLMDASLYMGEGWRPAGSFTLFSHDLTLLGEPLADLQGLLHLLQTFYCAHAVLSTGMTDLIEVRKNDEIRDLADPFRGQPEPDFEHIDVRGAIRIYEKRQARPLVVLDADEDDLVDLAAYATAHVDPVYEEFHQAVVRQSQIFLGLFLCARYLLGDAEIAALARGGDAFLFETPETAFSAKMRRLGRRLEGGVPSFQALMVSRALTTFCEGS